MQNMIINCIQCEEDFEFSVDDQMRYQKMNFDIPKRCPACRKNKANINVEFQDRRSHKRKKYNHRRYED